MRQIDQPASFLRRLLDVALEAVEPRELMTRHMPDYPAQGRAPVVGAGKAAAAMAQAFEEAWGERAEGLVVVPDGYGARLERIDLIEAGHPVPDRRGLEAAAKMLDLAEALGSDDTLIGLISGGGSALLPAPRGKITLEEKQRVTEGLLRAGAPIGQINLVRSSLSRIKGGGLLGAARPARILSFIISDVPGDDLAKVASGPTIPWVGSGKLARDILESHGIEIPDSVAAVLREPRENSVAEADERDQILLIGTAATALDAAQDLAQSRGATVVRLGDSLEGEARAMAADHAEVVRAAAGDRNFEGPTVFLSGGEATVKVLGDGRGGPNLEYLLALAIELEGRPDVWALAADTDGLDGTSGAAGAVLGPDSLAAAEASGLAPAALLAANDSRRFFEATKSLIEVGPTRTNVSDFRAILFCHLLGSPQFKKDRENTS